MICIGGWYELGCLVYTRLVALSVFGKRSDLNPLVDMTLQSPSLHWTLTKYKDEECLST